MPVHVTPELEELVHSIPREGQYTDETEILSEALRLLQRRDELRAQNRVGIDQLDRGEYFTNEDTNEEVFADLRTSQFD